MPTTNEVTAGKIPAPQAEQFSLREVFARLEDRRMLSPEKKALALKLLSPHRAELLQGITALTAMGAWLAALAFTAFVMILLEPKGGRGIMMGLGYCFGATMLRRIARHDFFVQAALAILLAGYGIALISIADSFHYSDRELARWSTCGAAMLLAAVLYVVYDYPLQRFVVPVIAAFILFSTVTELNHYEALHPLVLIETLALLFIFAGSTQRTGLRPLGHALAVALAVTVAPLTFPHGKPYDWPWGYATPIWLVPWPSQVLLATVLLWLACWAARIAHPETDARAALRRGPMLVALVTIVLLSVVSSPGILAGILLAALGHATRERLIGWLGLLVLAGSILLFYCDYKWTLSATGGLLAASGLVLLGARLILWRLSRGKEPR